MAYQDKVPSTWLVPPRIVPSIRNAPLGGIVKRPSPTLMGYKARLTKSILDFPGLGLGRIRENTKKTPSSITDDDRKKQTYQREKASSPERVPHTSTKPLVIVEIVVIGSETNPRTAFRSSFQGIPSIIPAPIARDWNAGNDLGPGVVTPWAAGLDAAPIEAQSSKECVTSASSPRAHSEIVEIPQPLLA
ncbi:hypothetical protein BJV78DRAFT_1151573 [Lactifluus subvellereus]|nr:hypothetical protein BJV78DRAFT_1151573 [Lactifluus subvellereus]